MRQSIETNRSNHFVVLLSLLLFACGWVNNGESLGMGGTTALGGISGNTGFGGVTSTGGSTYASFDTGPLDGTWLMDSVSACNGPLTTRPVSWPVIVTISGSTGLVTATLSNEGGTLGCSCAMNAQMVVNYPKENRFIFSYTSQSCAPDYCDTKCAWSGGGIIHCPPSSDTFYTGYYYDDNVAGSPALFVDHQDIEHPCLFVSLKRITPGSIPTTEITYDAGIGLDGGTSGSNIRITGLSTANGKIYVNGWSDVADTLRNKVIVYALISSGWYNKPPFPYEDTVINQDGTWAADITPEGVEPLATEIAAYLVPGIYNVPIPKGDPSLPTYFMGLPSACVNPQMIVPDADQSCP